MTVEEIKGSILLKLTGGNPSSDSSVWLSDIDTLLAPAVNFVQTKQYFIDGNAESEKHLIQQFMLQTYTVNIQEDTVRRRKYATLPKTPLSLPNGRALQFVGDVRGKGFVPLQQGGEDMQEYYEKFKKGITSYRPEGLKVYFWCLQPLQKQVLVKMLVDVKSLADNEELLLPSGGEIEVINLIYEWLSGQRATPKDVIIDQKDKPTG